MKKKKEHKHELKARSVIFGCKCGFHIATPASKEMQNVVYLRKTIK